MRTPILAIIGLPNVGKSTLFNKILQTRTALTYPEAGTTRDRAYGLTTWNGRDFYLVDTAGIARGTSDLEKNIQKQTQIALDEADLILLVVDGRTPPGSSDTVVATRLQKSGQPVILAVNKIDAHNARTTAAGEAYRRIGLGQPFLVSSVNGSGLGDLLDEIVGKLQPTTYNLQPQSGLRLAFVGKPNVGKSSLINALLQQERLLTHPLPGTTRSVVEVPFVHQGQSFILLDTAGIKKKWKQDSDVAAAAAFQSIRTINQTDVVLFTLDANLEITAQDQMVADQILEAQKPCVIVLNKVDLLADAQKNQLLDILPNYLPQMAYFPVVFTSSQTPEGLDRLLDLAAAAATAGVEKLDQAKLDKFLQTILAENMPGKMDDQRAPNFYDLVQTGTQPPTFTLTVNFPAAIATAWKQWLAKQFRLRFGLEGTPIIIKYLRKN